MILNLLEAAESHQRLDVTKIFANHQVYNRFCKSNDCKSFTPRPQAYYANRQASIAKYSRDEQRSVGKIVETVVHFNPYRLLLSTGRFELYALLLTRAAVKRQVVDDTIRADFSRTKPRCHLPLRIPRRRVTMSVDATLE